MLTVLVEVMRGQHGGEHRHVRVELHAHERVYHRCRHELVPVDPAVDHEGAAGQRGVPAGFRQSGDPQRDFEGAGNLDDVNVGESAFRQCGVAGRHGPVDDVGVPAGGDQCDAIRIG